MTVPATITTELTNLQAQVAAAAPLNNASFATVKAMQLNAINLIADIQAALTANSILDNPVVLTAPVAIIAQFQKVVVAGNDQSSLSLMRGVSGRALANLSQLV